MQDFSLPYAFTWDSFRIEGSISFIPEYSALHASFPKSRTCPIGNNQPMGIDRGLVTANISNQLTSSRFNKASAETAWIASGLCTGRQV